MLLLLDNSNSNSHHISITITILYIYIYCICTCTGISLKKCTVYLKYVYIWSVTPPDRICNNLLKYHTINTKWGSSVILWVSLMSFDMLFKTEHYNKYSTTFTANWFCQYSITLIVHFVCILVRYWYHINMQCICRYRTIIDNKSYSNKFFCI